MTPRRDVAVFQYDDKLMLIGGKDNSGIVTTNYYIYSPDYGITWATATDKMKLSPLFSPRYNAQVVVMPKKKRIYIVGGREADGSFIKDVWAGGKNSLVTDSLGRTIRFTYSGGRLASIVTPAGTFSYAYDAQGRLTAVKRPDGKTRKYEYTGQRLTGVIDATGLRVQTLGYDAAGRVTASALAGNTDLVTIGYPSALTRTVTDSMNVTLLRRKLASVFDAFRQSEHKHLCSSPCRLLPRSAEGHGLRELREAHRVSILVAFNHCIVSVVHRSFLSTRAGRGLLPSPLVGHHPACSWMLFHVLKSINI